jgi:hypothetical protein
MRMVGVSKAIHENLELSESGMTRYTRKNNLALAESNKGINAVLATRPCLKPHHRKKNALPYTALCKGNDRVSSTVRVG